MTSATGQREDIDGLHDPGEERVPIYSYPAKYRWIFTTCLVVGTLAVWVYRVVVELRVETADTWNATVDAILNALPMSGFTGVIAGIITVEVRIVVGELLQMRREKMKAKFKEAAAGNAELRQRLERNGPAEDAKQ